MSAVSTTTVTVEIRDRKSTPDLGELRRLLEAATPGPWEAWDNAHAETLVSEAGRRSFGVVTRPATGRDDYGHANAVLIAAAVNSLPSLLDDLDTAREEIATLTAQRDRAERRHERLESGVEALADLMQRINDEYEAGTRPIRPTNSVTAVRVAARLRALLAESGASEEGA